MSLQIFTLWPPIVYIFFVFVHYSLVTGVQSDYEIVLHSICFIRERKHYSCNQEIMNERLSGLLESKDEFSNWCILTSRMSKLGLIEWVTSWSSRLSHYEDFSNNPFCRVLEYNISMTSRTCYFVEFSMDHFNDLSNMLFSWLLE